MGKQVSTGGTGSTEHRCRRRGGFGRLVRLVSFALLVAAVTKELQKDPGERTWHGEIGFVPYDLRMPTIERARERLWNPDSEQLVGPHVFGVGWSVNVGRIVELVRRRAQGGESSA